MQNKWPTLTKAPIDVALFQLKFDMGDSEISDFRRYDSGFRTEFPINKADYSSEINIPGSRIPLGVSQVTGTSKTRITGYTYISQDQKSKIAIGEGSFTFIDEHQYKDWNAFVENINKHLSVVQPILNGHVMTRISVRFINRFVFDEFTNPLDYFRTAVSASDPEAVPYPVGKYSFNMNIPIDDSTYSIVKQDFDRVADKVNYIFDIDVLTRCNLMFDQGIIVDSLTKLREIKDNIFFGNITEKLIESCN